MNKTGQKKGWQHVTVASGPPRHVRRDKHKMAMWRSREEEAEMFEIKRQMNKYGFVLSDTEKKTLRVVRRPNAKLRSLAAGDAVMDDLVIGSIREELGRIYIELKNKRSDS